MKSTIQPLKGVVRRAFKRALSALAFCALTLCLGALIIWFLYLRNPDMAGEKIPTRAWSLIRNSYYDNKPERFTKGDALLSRYQTERQSTANNQSKQSVETVKTLLKTLDDRFTRLVTPQEFADTLRRVTSDEDSDDPTVLPDEPAVSTLELNRRGHHICYVKLRTFLKFGVADQLDHALRSLPNCDGYILDLRGNRGGFVSEAIKAASLFVQEGRLGSMILRVPGHGHTVVRIALKANSLRLQPLYSSLSLPLHRLEPIAAQPKPVFIMVDKKTASAAEAFTAMLQDNSAATVIGLDKTFGKGIGQTWFPLANGYWLSITNFYMLTPKGNWLGDGCQLVCNGLKPDIMLDKSVIKSSEDELTEALSVIDRSNP